MVTEENDCSVCVCVCVRACAGQVREGLLSVGLFV